MSSTYGEHLRLTIFGQSHSPAIGMTLEGLPAGEAVNLQELNRFLQRRAPGHSPHATARKEADAPEFLSGIREGFTCGAPLTAIIRNGDTRSRDYEELARLPRPGHADYTAWVKYGPHRDYAGGGHFSGRLTAPLCIAGGICLQLLRRRGVEVHARIVQIGTIRDESPFTAPVADKPFPVSDDAVGRAMEEAIAQAKGQADSIGGVVECLVTGLPAGLGDPMFGGMENRLASILFGIPAVKGVEFGDGFACAGRTGSENNDPFILRDGAVVTASNHCGGILGGISNGMPLVMRAAFKPTPSIGKPQRTVDLSNMTEAEVTVHGRHDPCIVLRAVPCVEAAAAVAIYDAWLCEHGYKE